MLLLFLNIEVVSKNFNNYYYICHGKSQKKFRRTARSLHVNALFCTSQARTSKQAHAFYITLLRLHAHCTSLHDFNLPVHAPDSGCTLFDSENDDNDERVTDT